MGYWENTAYIRTGNVDRIAKSLIEILAREGVHPIEKPPERERPQSSRMQYGSAEESLYWAIALIPAQDGWTAVKTAPLEMLLERAPGAKRARLSDIAVSLGVECFQFNIYDGAEFTCFECAPDGRIAVSGAAETNRFIEFDDRYHPIRFHGEPWGGVDPFTLIQGDAMDGIEITGDHEAFGKSMQVAGDGHINAVQVDHLIPFRPLDTAGSRTLYFQNIQGKRLL